MTGEAALECRWDWYEGTVFGVDADTVVPAVARVYGWRSVANTSVTVDPCRGLHGYLNGVRIAKGSERLCDVMWGGNPGVHVIASGEPSPRLWQAVNKLVMDHRCEWSPSRVDAAVDWIEAELFDELAGPALAFAERQRIAIDQQGDWHRGKGRTLYLGAKSSVVRLRLYEKGYQVGGGADLNWVRWEVVVRPKTHARAEVATWAPADALGASAWLVDLQRELGLGERMRHAVGTVWRPSDSDRARRALVKQYARVVLGWFDECGSWERLGIELGTHVLRSVERPVVQNLLQPISGDTAAVLEQENETEGAPARVECA